MRENPFCAPITTVGRIGGGPPLREEGERREKFTANLKAALAAEATAAGKAAALRRAYKAEPSPDVRRVVFEHVPTPPDAPFINTLSPGRTFP